MEIKIRQTNKLIYELTKKGVIQIDYVKIKIANSDYIDGYIAEVQPFREPTEYHENWPVRSKNGIPVFDSFSEALKASIQLLTGLENIFDGDLLNIVIADYL